MKTSDKAIGLLGPVGLASLVGKKAGSYVLEDILDAGKEFGRDVADSHGRRTQRFSDDMSKYSEGTINGPELALRGAGEAVGLGMDIAGEAVGAGSQVLVPFDEEIVAAVSPLIKKGLQHVIDGVMDTGAAKTALKWAEDNPEEARNVLSFLSVSQVLAPMAASRVGKAMTTYGPEASKGGTVSNFSNYIKSWYSPDPAGPTKAEGLLGDVIGKGAEKVGSSLPKGRGEAIAQKASGAGQWATEGVADSLTHLINPVSRATYGQHGISSGSQKHIARSLEPGVGRGEEKAMAQALYANHINRQARREGPVAPELREIDVRSTAMEPFKAEDGNISAALQRVGSKRDDNIGARGDKPLDSTSSEWDALPEDHVSAKDADLVERWIKSVVPEVDTVVMKTPTGKSGNHFHDFAYGSPHGGSAAKVMAELPPNPTVSQMFDAFNKEHKSFVATRNKKIKQTGNKKQPFWRVLNPDKEHAEKHGLWLQGSKVGSAITEGGASYVSKMEPNGRFMTVVVDKHDFGEKLPLIGPAVNKGILPEQLVAITPPMFNDLTNVKPKAFKKARGDKRDAKWKGVGIRKEMEGKNRDVLKTLSELRPSRRNVAGESVQVAGNLGLLGGALWTEE